jgi:hypothetical protein
VRAFKVVVADELRELASGFLAVVVFGHLQFVLDGSKSGFGKSIVVAIIGSAHAGPNTRCCFVDTSFSLLSTRRSSEHRMFDGTSLIPLPGPR